VANSVKSIDKPKDNDYFSPIRIAVVGSVQKRRAIEALEARAPSPDSVATLVNSLQNRVNSITLCKTLNAKTGKIQGGPKK